MVGLGVTALKDQVAVLNLGHITIPIAIPTTAIPISNFSDLADLSCLVSSIPLTPKYEHFFISLFWKEHKTIFSVACHFLYVPVHDEDSDEQSHRGRSKKSRHSDPSDRSRKVKLIRQ